jgi:hypothetical protein
VLVTAREREKERERESERKKEEGRRRSELCGPRGVDGKTERGLRGGG